MRPYEIIEHTADVGIKANGLTLKELFENAAKGMFAIIIGEGIFKDVKSSERRIVEIKKEVDDFEMLLVDWLGEVLYTINKENIFCTNFKILELNNKGVRGEVYGKKIDPAKNKFQTEIKAVTFHELNIEKNLDRFSCTIIFDV